MRKLLRRAIVLVVLLAILAIVVWLYLDKLAKTGIERGASYALGCKTTVDSVGLRPFSGEAQVNGLTVANPDGYKAPHLVKTGRFDVSIRTGSLMSDTIEVSRFELDGLDLYIEQTLGGSNVQKVLEHIEATAGGDEKNPTVEGDAGKKVKVDRIVIRNVEAHVQVLPIPGQASMLNVKVPEIVLEGVTSDNAQGVAVAELTRRLLPAIIAAVVEKGGGVLPKNLTAGLNAGVASATQAVGGVATKMVEQMGGQAAKFLERLRLPGAKPADESAAPPAEGEAKPGIGNPLEGLKGILGGKKDGEK
jgi:hypothetical protein